MPSTPVFFTDSRIDFFAPLNGKYREINAQCIKQLYLRLNGPEADYAYNLTRQDVLDIFLQAIRAHPIVLLAGETDAAAADNPDADSSVEPQNPVQLARDTYHKLKRYGWIEEYMDPGMMETVVRFSPYGRQFAIPFVQQHSEIITNTQHTRSTLAHLQSFIARLADNLISVSDLMIATKLAFEIIADFNELIEALVEKRRELMASVNREIQQAKQAGESFFEFMEKRFMPDIRFRFSADSVERYRHEILDCLNQIRRCTDQTKQVIEQEIRRSHPTLLSPERPVVLYWALDQIEHHVTTACDVKLPELRAETENFVRRAQALITHIASLSLGEADSETIFSIAARLAQLNDADLDRVFDHPKARFSHIELALYNPGKITAPVAAKKEAVVTTFDEVEQMDPQVRRQAYIRAQLERSFAVEGSKISDYVVKQLAGGRRIKAALLPITDVKSLLAAIHAPQLASVSGGEKPCFRISASENVNNDYYSGDGFELEYIPPDIR